jgi:hypothetical protein
MMLSKKDAFTKQCPPQGWGKIRPIRIRIRIREYSANSNFENDWKIRRIRIRLPTQKFAFESNPVSKIREYLPRIRIHIMIVHHVIQHPVPSWMARDWQLLKADRKRKYVSAQKRDLTISGNITNPSQSDRITVLERI